MNETIASQISTYGYAYLQLIDDELDMIKQFIRASVKKVLSGAGVAIDTKGDILHTYHNIVTDKEHSLFTKRRRCLEFGNVSQYYSFNYIEQIRKEFGLVEISDEHGWGFPEFYYRLVRPNKESDVGPIHRDADFWSLHPEWIVPKSMPFRRLKVWIPVQTPLNGCGLSVYPRSHREEILYKAERRHGDVKPVLIDGDRLENSLKSLSCEPGSVVVFDDRLVHAGYVCKGESARVSIEQTLFVSERQLDT